MRSVVLIAFAVAAACAADKPVTLEVAPLSRGTRGVDVELTGALLKACPSVDIVGRSAVRSYYLAWEYAEALLGSRVSVVLYREPEGVAVASFTERSVKSVAKDVCSAIARR